MISGFISDQEVSVMLTIIFFIAVIWVTWKIFVLGLKLAWGIVKLLFSVLLFPLTLLCMAAAGLVYLAIPILILAAIIVLIRQHSSV